MLKKRKGTTVADPPATNSKRNRLIRLEESSIKEDKHYSNPSSNGPTPAQQNIKKLFDQYRDDPINSPDTINIDGAGQYLQDLNVALDDASVMAIFDLLDAPAMGEFSRDGFVGGWSSVSSLSNPCDSAASQSKHVQTLRQKLSSDPTYFRQVYRSAFKYAKPANQRAVPVDDAFAYWDMFFRAGKGGIEWNSSTTRWMDLWTDFYRSKVNRPVNKDLWNQVAALVEKTREPGGEKMEWWSEDGAWPTAVDEFVAYVRQKREAAGQMDTS